jgi:6-phosphogluconolactonase (cycloisomerase 2 family)
MKDKALSRTTCAVFLLLALSGLASCGGNSSKGTSPPPPPAPTITTISPSSAVAGGAAFTLTINGTNFIASSTVNFGGSTTVTTFVNSTQLTAIIPASSIASTGTPAVTVTNPAPGGGTSNAINFPVTNAATSAPMINSIFPSCVPAGEQFINQFFNFENNQLSVNGLNFEASSVVQWNGSNRPTTLDPNSQGQSLTALLSASDIASPGTAAVTVFNPAPGLGTSNSLPFTIMTGTVNPQSIAVDPAGKFAYVANVGCSGEAGYVSMYTINSTTGALTSIGPPAASLDATANSVTVDPSGKFAYVANTGDGETTDGSVISYTINATTGALTATGAINGNCPGLCIPLSAAVGPSGKFAYVPNGDGIEPNNVSVYAIDATTGALTSVGQTTVQGFADSVAVDPSGKFAYVATSSFTPNAAGSVSMYTINATTGALASIGTIAAAINPGSIVVDPAGKFAYVANPGSNDVSMYTINATTGALTSVGTIATGSDPVSIAVDPASKFAYVVNFSSNDVSMYTIDATTGALTSTGTIATGQSPTSIAIHPSGNFAYVTNSASNDVSMYSIDGTTGALTLIGTIGT